jgi:aromatic amino acid aminotransferase I
MAPPIAIDVVGVSDTEGVVLPTPLTVNGIAELRAKAGKLIAGTAAWTSSEFFKSSVSHISRLEISHFDLYN